MKALVVLSGGQDSTTCLFLAKQFYEEVHALTIQYGQRHFIEIDSAKIVARMADVLSHEVLELGTDVLKSTSPLVSSNPVGQYETIAELPGGVEPTFIPARNPLFLVLAANRAVAVDANVIVTGVCEADYAGYYDCRRVAIDGLEYALSQSIYGLDKGITIETPLMTKTKAESVRMAKDIPGCWEALAYSHTCYNGVFPPCGSCHACLLRARGFEEAGEKDPLLERALKYE